MHYSKLKIISYKYGNSYERNNIIAGFTPYEKTAEVVIYKWINNN